MNTEEIFSLTVDDFPSDLVFKIHPTGSKYICNPPVLSTDEDYFVATKQFTNLCAWLVANGWEMCCETIYDESYFLAVRKGKYNLVILRDCNSFDKNVYATEFAKRLNITNKQDRIDLFDLVRTGKYGNS